MKEMQFTVKISAPREKVWDTLWQDKTLREWAGLIDPGTYMVGELKAGNKVQWISAENGYGVTSLIKEVIPNEYLLLLHQADTQDTGTRERDKQWTGGKESYTLTDIGGVTELSTSFDVPPELEEYFAKSYPVALEKVKVLAEQSTIQNS